MESNVSNFFSFTSFLTGLAFLIMAWANMDYKYRLRLYLSKFSKVKMFVAVVVIGILVLASDFIIAQNYPIPYTPCAQHIWQLVLALSFFYLTSRWISVSFLFPAKYNSRNCHKFEKELDNALKYGQDNKMHGVMDFFKRSISEIVKFAPRDFDDNKTLSKKEKCTLHILHLMGNEYFCKIVIKYYPEVVEGIFCEMKRQNKYDIDVKLFAEHLVTQALLCENSFIFRETNLLTEIYSNVELIQKYPELLEPHHNLTSKWNSEQIHAYAKVLLVTLNTVLKEGCYNPYLYHHFFDIMESSARRVGYINGLGSDYFENENYCVYRIVIHFYEELVQSIAVMNKIKDIHGKYEEKNEKKDITDIIADSIVKLMSATSQLITPQETSRFVRKFEFCGLVLEHKQESTMYDMLIRKICRALYKAFKANDENGTNLLIFCLDCYGLNYTKHASKSIRLLSRFAVFYARHHLLKMYNEVSKNRYFKLPDGITIKIKQKQLRKIFVPDIYGKTHEEILNLVG